MEIITIEKKVFEAMLEQLGKLTKQMDALSRETDEKRMSKWLDNQDVCMALGVSLRTLQTYRDTRQLPYTQIGYKIFYRPDDVQKMMQKTDSP